MLESTSSHTLRHLFLFVVVTLLCLGEATASQWITDRTARPLAWLKDNCIPLNDAYANSPDVQRECKVTESGDLFLPDGKRMYYALYRRLAWKHGQKTNVGSIYDKFPSHNTAVVIFETEGEMTKPIWADLSDQNWLGTWYQTPRILVTKLGTILEVVIRSGPKVEPHDKHLLWQSGQWQLLDTNSWRSEVNKRLPAGYSAWVVRMGVDMVNMKAEGPVWEGNDAMCCPTGGTVIINFVLRGQRLEIKEFKHVTDPK